MKQLDFFNTVPLTGVELEIQTEKAINHSDKVLDFFKTNKGSFTPYEVNDALGLSPYQLSSTRRAITVLTDGGKLINTKIKKLSPMGVKNNTWRLK